MKISVLIPNYNHGKLIEDCLMRYINQTKLPYEIIFVDDGSKDNSVEIIRNIIKSYSKIISIKLIRNKKI